MKLVPVSTILKELGVAIVVADVGFLAVTVGVYVALVVKHPVHPVVSGVKPAGPWFITKLNV